MMVLREIRRRTPQILGQLALAGTLVYFGYHAFNGDRSVLAWMRLENEVAQARATLGEVTRKRAELAHVVGLLKPGHLDPDLIEERARLLLNYGRPDELLVILPADRGP